MGGSCCSSCSCDRGKTKSTPSLPGLRLEFDNIRFDIFTYRDKMNSGIFGNSAMGRFLNQSTYILIAICNIVLSLILQTTFLLARATEGNPLYVSLHQLVS